jgi:phosphatidylserine/phosphatidylglycerophosphate/cardiolipin synthase-like enzyme
MATDDKKPPDPLNDPLETVPPDKLVNRTATVFVHGRESILNTVRMPNDPRHIEAGRWFNLTTTRNSSGQPSDTGGNLMPPVHKKNEVTYLIDAADIPGFNTQGNGSPTVRAFARMQEAIEDANGPDDFIYMLNWWFEDQFVINTKATRKDGTALVPKTMEQLLSEASDKRNVDVRAMFWFQKSLSLPVIEHYIAPVLNDIAFEGVADAVVSALDFVGLVPTFSIVDQQNRREVIHINKLKNGGAILDDRTLDFGSHHHKILVVKKGQEVVSFCGGVDFNQDRIDVVKKPSASSSGIGQPLHDVHCQVRGPAAMDLLRTFCERWEEYVKEVLKLKDQELSDRVQELLGAFLTLAAGSIPSGPILKGFRLKLAKPLVGRKLVNKFYKDLDEGIDSTVGSDPALNGEQFVQIGRTYGNGNKHAGIDAPEVPLGDAIDKVIDEKDPLHLGSVVSAINKVLNFIKFLLSIIFFIPLKVSHLLADLIDVLLRYLFHTGYKFETPSALISHRDKDDKPGETPKHIAIQGEQTAREIIANAIRVAQRFIYIEDQYLVGQRPITSDLALTKLLIDALRRVEHITILVPHGSISDQPDGRFHRWTQFLDPLLKADTTKKKVRVFCRAEASNASPSDSGAAKAHTVKRKNANGEEKTFRVDLTHTYIHAKLVIVDDRFASIGTVNCNQRGWSHDSEVTAGIFDESHDDKMTLHFAHRLRIKLWAEHLRMDNPDGHAELWDGVASSVLWDRLPPITRVIPYVTPEDRDADTAPSNRVLVAKILHTLGEIPIFGPLGKLLEKDKGETFFEKVVDPDGS